ncbi:MAG: SDR family oxidoreductase [Solirubrobacterales bacterium]|nr:SDR family oxidoreductase [Solirubrobacterales bacterium]
MSEKTGFCDFTGQAALVTGCGSEFGIGFATARLLGRQGAKVAVTATSERVNERCAELVADGIEASAHVADLTEAGEADRIVAEAVAVHGRIDVLVNNAGMSKVGTEDLGRRFDELSEEEWRAGIEQNLHLAAAVTRAALPQITRSGNGRIVFVTSVTGPVVSNPGNPAYSASKAGLDGLMRALAIELGPGGTTVNSVNPGWIETGSATPDEVKAGRHTPVGRPGTPDEVAAAVLMLAAPEASYITGQTLIVDGGNVIQEYKGPQR